MLKPLIAPKAEIIGNIRKIINKEKVINKNIFILLTLLFFAILINIIINNTYNASHKYFIVNNQK